MHVHPPCHAVVPGSERIHSDAHGLFIQTPRTRRRITKAFMMEPDFGLLEVRSCEQRVAYDFGSLALSCCYDVDVFL